MSSRKQTKQPQMEKLQVGTLVELKGLKGAAQYNGKKGIIAGPYDAAKGRYPIKIKGTGKTLAIRLVNFDLVKVAEDIPTSSDPADLDGGGWSLVRQVKGTSWHPAKDHLTGTSEYDEGNGTFSIRFDTDDFDQFLFATGDGAKWLIADKDEVVGEWYQNELKTILKSSKSSSSHQARWYRRKICSEDPWISLSDHIVADRNGDMLYGGSGDREHSGALSAHDGARVYIRNSKAKSGKKNKSKKKIPIKKAFGLKLKSLDFSACRYASKDALTIASCLKENATVTEMNLNFCRIGQIGANAISESLTINDTLRKLEVSGDSIGDLGAISLVDALKKNSTLTWLDISYNDIGDKGIQATVELLEQNITLKCLVLCGNKIGDLGIKDIGKSLKKNKSLTRLDLSGSIYQPGEIGDIGASAIAEVLRVNMTLLELHLYNQKISDKGAEEIGQSLIVNSGLTKLDISNNEIGNVGAATIAEALKINTMLKMIYLHHNKIGDIGIQAIGEGLQENRTLHTVYLNDNDFSEKSQNAVELATQKHPLLSTIVI